MYAYEYFGFINYWLDQLSDQILGPFCLLE